MSELIPWLIAIIGVLFGLLGFNIRKIAKQDEKTQRERADSVLKAKGVYDDVQMLDDDRLVAEFDRLYNDKRR